MTLNVSQLAAYVAAVLAVGLGAADAFAHLHGFPSEVDLSLVTAGLTGLGLGGAYTAGAKVGASLK